jgi:hypothetical protein
MNGVGYVSFYPICWKPKVINTYVRTYTYVIPFKLYPERVTEASQVFLRDAHILPKLFSYK